jgi:predicted transposase YbfD/YdcC
VEASSHRLPATGAPLLLHPSIAESGFAALGAAVSAPVGGPDLPDPAVVCPDLLQRFAAVSDGRRDQGRVHPVAVVLVLCAAAVVAGMASFTAIAGWATDVPAEMLARLYGRRCDPPSKATIWRVVTGVDADAVDAVIGAWLLAHAAGRDAAGREVAPDEVAGREVAPGEIAPGEVAVREADQDVTEPLAIMVDGKAVRGATDAEGNQVHLLAAATHADALVLGQVEVGAKSNEIPQFAPLLNTLAATGVDLAHTVITADALHTQRAHADYLHERGAGFVLTCKQNQPRLFAALDALPWTQTPVAARELDRGHGRITTRTIQVLPAPADLPFPHVQQVWLIERYVTAPDGTPRSAVAALGVTNLPATRATPAHLADLVRRHWGIESLHWLRDTVYREDDSTVRTRSGPRVMASLRNLALGAIRLTGRRDITETTREAARNMARPFKILQFT